MRRFVVQTNVVVGVLLGDYLGLGAPVCWGLDWDIPRSKRWWMVGLMVLVTVITHADAVKMFIGAGSGSKQMLDTFRGE